jgi:protocatechuate 3,4-dioxygenase beta subunit
MTVRIPAHDLDPHLGLAQDLRVMSRRRMFGLLAGGAALLPVLGACTTTSEDLAAGPDAGGVDGTTGTCSTIPEETAGPYPGDGTNGANALVLAGIVRSDITASIAGASGVADGVPLTVTLTIVDASTCEPLAGRAVYLWHCDRDGNYSMYSPAIAGENYLRGVQETNAAGAVTFTTIFPACYSGRWPHIHFEVYASIAEATSGANKLATSQLALPKATCDLVFATAGYDNSVSNLAQVSLASDMVFSDGATLEIPTMTGSVADGLGASLTVAV